MTLNVAVANGLGNAKKLVKAVQDGTANFHFVEVRLWCKWAWEAYSTGQPGLDAAGAPYCKGVC